jgi:hypothetical protein
MLALSRRIAANGDGLLPERHSMHVSLDKDMLFNSIPDIQPRFVEPLW